MTHPMPEINTLLKQVRLLHVMEQLPLRNRESIERKLAYPEFLSLVIQDEILGRDNKTLNTDFHMPFKSRISPLTKFEHI